MTTHQWDTSQEVNRIRQALNSQALNAVNPKHGEDLKAAQQQQTRLQFDLAAFLGCSPGVGALTEASLLFQGLIEANYRKYESVFR